MDSENKLKVLLIVKNNFLNYYNNQIDTINDKMNKLCIHVTKEWKQESLNAAKYDISILNDELMTCQTYIDILTLTNEQDNNEMLLLYNAYETRRNSIIIIKQEIKKIKKLKINSYIPPTEGSESIEYHNLRFNLNIIKKYIKNITY